MQLSEIDGSASRLSLFGSGVASLWISTGRSAAGDISMSVTPSSGTEDIGADGAGAVEFDGVVYTTDEVEDWCKRGGYCRCDLEHS